MDAKGEVMLAIMASLAQQESQSLSQNVKLGLQYRYQQGEIQVNCNWFLGYAKDENKHLVVVPEEAEIVKRIYREYLEGASMLKIARGSGGRRYPERRGSGKVAYQQYQHRFCGMKNTLATPFYRKPTP
jgi:DNA invertase Pin-like site-specific DNA recombinase